MAGGKMGEIAERLAREHGPLRIAMHHRVGDLRIGDIAVVVAAAAPHRDAAFAAARAAIDELKSIVPIWKKEHAENGAIWIEEDRKSTRLNSSHSQISYAVFCL